MKFARLIILLLVSVAVLPAFAAPTQAAGSHTAGFYDNQIIEYDPATSSADTVQAALLISKGSIVYHIVGPDGQVPAEQCARFLAALPNDRTDCNTLNAIPTDKGYTGGAWNLQIFHWNPGITPYELSKDDDIKAAAAAGLGSIEVTTTLVRCPVINFANLR